MIKVNKPAAIAATTYLAFSLVWLGFTYIVASELAVVSEFERGFASLSFAAFIFTTTILLYFLVSKQIERAVAYHNEVVLAQTDLIRHLAQAGEWRDNETGEHVERVSSFAFEIAKEYGLPAQTCEIVRLAATTHDIGKIGIPDSVVMFSGTYSIEQRAQMQAHTLIGGQILRSGHGELAETARRTALCHHEWWDGTGYPAGLKGEEIHLAARITAVADVFDALISTRRYKDAWTWNDALIMIEESAGTQLDPTVVAAFVRAHDSIRKVWVDSLPSADCPESPGPLTLAS